MNVLHLALVSECNDYAIDRGFTERGHEVHRIDWRAHGGHSNIQARARAEWADVCFFQGQGTNTIHTDTLDHLRANNVFVVNWTGDVRDDVNWYAEMALHVDLTLFTNRTDVEALRALGHRAHFLQVGYDDRIYHNNSNNKRAGVVFLGNNYPNRFPETASRMRMVEAMREHLPNDFKLYGRNWLKSWRIPNLTAHDEVKTYHRALIAINWDHYNRPGFYSDRMLRAMACGCKVIDAQRCVGYDIEAMVEAVGDALKDPERAMDHGRKNAESAKAHGRWANRVETLEHIIAGTEYNTTDVHLHG